MSIGNVAAVSSWRCCVWLLLAPGAMLWAEDEPASRAGRSNRSATKASGERASGERAYGEKASGEKAAAERGDKEEELEPLSTAAQAALGQLQRDLPSDSEGRAMLDDIVKGSRSTARR